jgi:mono/diheme cytochrome c family protein
MTLRTTVALSASGAVLWLATAGGVAHAEDAAGQALFLEQGCHACHAVPAAGIAMAGDDTISAPVLEGLADHYKPCKLKRWLKRERDQEGYTHLQYFRGTDEELQVLVGWLIEQ